MKKLNGRPYGVFVGVNMMTPDVLGYYQITIDGVTVYAELSTGEGLLTPGPIYGVTVRRPGGARLDPDPSSCYRSQKEAMQTIVDLDAKVN